MSSYTLKMHQNVSSGASSPDSTGELIALPTQLDGFDAATSWQEGDTKGERKGK